ncbi:MAG TPA: type II secretion system protein N [Candidatus Acidoferrum sp.]|nr:type II secretion system protein N [Candidatus Acidoferrum sp.]
MSRRLPLLTVLFVVIALAFAGLIARELTSAPPPGPASRPQPAASGTAATPAASPGSSAAQNYSAVASRNLFSPTRSEAPPAPVTPAAPPAPILPKPNLFGVILIEGTPVAYLEDPVSKRVARYRVGDSVAGGTVKSIESDTVMLLRPEGQVTVRLHDPTRPKAGLPPTQGVPGMPGMPGVPGMPGTPGAPGMPTGQPPAPGIPQQGVTPEGRPTITQPRRPGAVFGRYPSQPTDATKPQ